MLELSSVWDVVGHAPSWGEVGHRRYQTELEERHNIRRGPGCISGRLRSLYLLPSYADRTKPANVKEDAIINPKRLWDCHYVGPSNEPDHCQN